MIYLPDTCTIFSTHVQVLRPVVSGEVYFGFCSRGKKGGRGGGGEGFPIHSLKKLSLIGGLGERGEGRRKKKGC